MANSTERLPKTMVLEQRILLYFLTCMKQAPLLVGGTLTAVDEVMTGKSLHALHLGGGLASRISGEKHLDFVFIMIVRSPSNTFRKNIMLVFYMWIQMPIMEMVFNGLFMMIQMSVPCRFMKQEDIYFLVPAM